MATFVLVHGACAGGWSWKKLAPLLREAGHEVSTPTLTGLGDRAHLDRVDIDLDTYIQDVARLLHFEDLHEVLLVGWSFGGMVITGVAEQVPERLARLVYLDATVPADGQSLADAEPDGAAWVAQLRAAGAAAGLPGYWPVPVAYIQELVTDSVDQAWMLARLTPQPLAPFVQPVRLHNAAAARLPRTYIRCTEGVAPAELEAAYLARARTQPGWDYRELPSNHAAPFVAPRLTAARLLSLI
jgi:pimeloyl-ACP methyl ester carboxylesterase